MDNELILEKRVLKALIETILFIKFNSKNLRIYQ